ncbi:MAG: glycosyltransferase family 39 protein [Nanoarchaeota archaeon]
MKKTEVILLSIFVIILLFAFFIRVYNLGDSPLWIDESISAIASQNILEKGVPVLDSGVLYSRAYFFHYIMAFFMLFSHSDFAIRFISVIFGLLTIILGYFIGREYSKTSGILTALFLGVFYLEVFFSRQARFYQLFQLAFFASLYFLYKSKDKKWFGYLAVLFLFIAVDSHIAGLVLVPFFVFWLVIYNRKEWWLAVISAIPLLYNIVSFFSIPKSSSNAVSYVSYYASYASNMYYLLILAIPGSIWSYTKKKRLTLLLLIPSLVLLVGVFFVKLFAIRYTYFFVFPVILYSSVLLGLLYEKYGKIILIPIIALLIIPSSLFFPYTYTNVISPVKHEYRDFTSPTIDYKSVPKDLNNEMKNITTVVFFSPSFEWYVKKPDYVVDFSLSGLSDDIEINNLDVYSGAKIIKSKEEINGSYYLAADSFSLSKLNVQQMELFSSLKENCISSYKANDLEIFRCRK